MGAQEFMDVGRGKTAAAAFKQARDQALYDHGHAGYSGTLAEKHDFTEIEVPDGHDPARYATELMEQDDSRIADKWGAAGCVKLRDGEWLFFGWASS
jgi:hypothetical protein